jgi:hypothetical protein
MNTNQADTVIVHDKGVTYVRIDPETGAGHATSYDLSKAGVDSGYGHGEGSKTKYINQDVPEGKTGERLDIDLSKANSGKVAGDPLADGAAEPAAPASKPSAPTTGRPTTGARLRSAAGVGGKVLLAVGVALTVKDVYKSVKKGEYQQAALTASVGTLATALSLTAAAPVVLAAGIALKYHSDPTIEQRAFAAGDIVQQATGSVVAGALVSAGNAVGLSIYEAGADLAHGVANFFNDW